MPDAAPIDCDVHPTVPALSVLLPYLEPMWREAVQRRGLEELNSTGYPANAPLTVRADWRDAEGKAPNRCRAHGRAIARPVRCPPSPSATASMACNCCSVRTLPPPSPARSTTGSPASGWTPIPACAPPSSSPAEPPHRRRGDRALRRRSPLRPGAAAGVGRNPARPPPALADLRGRQSPRTAHRRPCRQRVPPSRSPRSAGRPA